MYRICSFKKSDCNFPNNELECDPDQEFLSQSIEEISGNYINGTCIAEAHLEWSSAAYSSFRIDA